MNFKKLLSLLVCFVAITAYAQNKTPFVLSADKFPNVWKFLPDPPARTDPLYFNDIVQYENGKKLRDTERGELAVRDTSYAVDYYMQRFGAAMGYDLTPETYPALNDLIYSTNWSARYCVSAAKKHYHRQRPFFAFNEPSGIPELEASTSEYESFPSGHTTRAWAVALTLARIDSVHQDTILATGWQLGQSRVIVGYHYQSDVDASRILAGITYSILATQPEWQELFEKAKAEFKKKQTAVSTAKSSTPVSANSEQIYDLQGIKTTNTQKNQVYIKGAKKYVK